jgi:hypothetical protein
MKINISRPVFSLVFMVMLHSVPVPRSEAFLGGLWETVKSWFGGGDKVDAELEASLKVALEGTNQTQNEVISAINEVVILQKQLQDVKDPADKAKLELKMQAMQNAVQQNNNAYMQLMEIRTKLQEAGVAEKYDAQFAPYMGKQQEIESHYRPIEDRYNELVAFSAGAEDNTLPTSGIDAAEATAATVAVAPAVPVWQKNDARLGIDAWLEANGLDEWGRPVVDGVTSGGAPVGGVGKDRHQYLFDTFPKLREHLAANGISADSAQVVAEVPYSDSDDAVYTGSDTNIVENLDNEGPAAAVSTPVPAATAPVRGGYAFQNRYDNASLRLERDQVYRDLNALIAEGKVESTEYKQLYLKYTQLSEQINK